MTAGKIIEEVIGILDLYHGIGDVRRHGDLGILTRHDRKGLLAAECHIVVSLDRDVAGLDDRLIFAFV